MVPHARARLIERLKAADAGRSSGAIKVAGGPTAAEVIARFGQQGAGPSDETVRLWIREHKEAQVGQSTGWSVPMLDGRAPDQRNRRWVGSTAVAAAAASKPVPKNPAIRSHSCTGSASIRS
jgi:hypothetical protein